MTCPPLLQAAPKPTNSASPVPVTVREDTPWPSAGKMLGNLFEERNWVLPKDYLAIEDKKGGCYHSKASSKRRIQNGRANFQPEGRKAQKKDGKDQQQKPLPKLPAKRPDTPSMTKTRQQWEGEMERLNTKYNIDCFSDSDFDSESDEDEHYQYEHGCETLICRTLENQNNRRARIVLW